MFFREHHSSNLSFGWSGGGGATIVLEDLGADAPATVTRAEFGMCAGHGVRSPTSSKVQEAGPSHGLGRGVRPLRSLRGCWASPWRAGFAGAVAAPDIRTLKSPTARGKPLKLFEVSWSRCKQTSKAVGVSKVFDAGAATAPACPARQGDARQPRRLRSGRTPLPRP